MVTLLAGPALGWHNDIAENVIRMYASGLFDRVPRVKVIIGHMGEIIPFMLERIDRFINRRWKGSSKTLKRTFLEVWNENFWITTSGMWSLGPFACLVRMAAVDRILYSTFPTIRADSQTSNNYTAGVDYPFENNEEGEAFIKDVRNSGLITEEQYNMIAY